MQNNASPDIPFDPFRAYSSLQRAFDKAVDANKTGTQGVDEQCVEPEDTNYTQGTLDEEIERLRHQLWQVAQSGDVDRVGQEYQRLCRQPLKLFDGEFSE